MDTCLEMTKFVLNNLNNFDLQINFLLNHPRVFIMTIEDI